MNAVTGNDGTFAFENPDSGKLILKVSKSSFVSNSHEVVVQAEGNTWVGDFTILKIPTASAIDFGVSYSSIVYVACNNLYAFICEQDIFNPGFDAVNLNTRLRVGLPYGLRTAIDDNFSAEITYGGTSAYIASPDAQKIVKIRNAEDVNKTDTSIILGAYPYDAEIYEGSLYTISKSITGDGIIHKIDTSSMLAVDSFTIPSFPINYTTVIGPSIAIAFGYAFVGNGGLALGKANWPESI